MRPESPKYLEDIRDAAAFVLGVAEERSFERYLKDRLARQAVATEKRGGRLSAIIMSYVKVECRSALAALAILLGAAVSAPAQEIVVEEPAEFLTSVDPVELENCFPRAEEAQERLDGFLKGDALVTVREFLGPVSRVSIRGRSPHLTADQAISLVGRWLDSPMIDPERDRWRGVPSMENIFPPTTVLAKVEGLLVYRRCEPLTRPDTGAAIPGAVACEDLCSPGRFVLFGHPETTELGPFIARDAEGVFWWYWPPPPEPEVE